MNRKFTQEKKQTLINRYLFGESVICITDDTGMARRTLCSWINAYKENLGKDIKITLKKAYKTRKPSEELSFHTVNGSNYLSNTFMGYLSSLGVKQSFSRVHVPYDNSVCESFFSSMKREELYRFNYPSVAEFKRSVEEYIHFFNSECPHATLKYKTPNKYEADF